MKRYNLTATVRCFLVTGKTEDVRVSTLIEARDRAKANEAIGAVTWEYITDKGVKITSAPVESTDVLKYHLAAA